MRAIIMTLILAVATQTTYSQSTARERIEQRQQVEATNANIRSSVQISDPDLQLNEILSNSRWSRVIYRHLDLTNPTNAALYYPETPFDGKMNLFATIYTLLQNNQIKAYEYIDGREQFTDQYLINLEELKERFDLYDDEIPSSEVRSYYLKEVYYFDTPTSSFRVQPIAICPIIHRFDNYEGTTRYPLFWVPYTQIEHYTRQMQVMLSSSNNSMRGSIDDFFRSRRYEGEIYKTGNSGNFSISQYTTSPEELKAEQERIEQELKDFEHNLRHSQTTTPNNSNQGRKQQNIRTSRNQNRSINVQSAGGAGSEQTMRNRRY